MNRRKHVLPKNSRDLLCMSFIVFTMPIGFCFEVFLVFPTLHEIPSIQYIIHVLFAIFLLVNTASNYVFLVLTDTSVQKAIAPETVIVNTDSWRFCKACDIFIPRKSWHCDICGTCVLRRDHHCPFSGCCIGRNNYRYFIHFLASFALSSVYMLVLNTYFVSRFFEVVHLSLVLNLMFPLVVVWFLRPPLFSAEQWCTVVLAVNLLGAAVSLVLVCTYGSRILRGLESQRSLVQVLGRRWYLTWLSPLVHSQLPADAEQWAAHQWDKTTKIV